MIEILKRKYYGQNILDLQPLSRCNGVFPFMVSFTCRVELKEDLDFESKFEKVFLKELKKNIDKALKELE